MTTLPPPPPFELRGGRLCLDFVNTVGNHRAGEPREYLTSYGLLVAWAEQAGALDAETAAELRVEAARRPDDASCALAEALALREALYRIFRSAIGGRPSAGEDLALLNLHLGRALGRQRLRPGGEGGCYRLVWCDDRALDAPLGPVVKSAAELLTGGELGRVRECDASAWNACGWLFVDESHRRIRRWCSMSDCGNQAKGRRRYAREKGAKGAEGG
ncbi:MAG TPA: ABATE domain-containing protein [Polyangiaceae bacterium]|nr:ABATE domain-containing protein [Polyangiaceae bacterium]